MLRNKIYLLIFLICTAFSFGSTHNKLDSIPLGEYQYIENTNDDNLRIVQAVKVTSVDPIKAKDQYSTRVIEKMYDTLFEYNKEGKIEPHLVKEWNWFDDRTLSLKLKDNVYFHNGEEMTAQDVKKSFERMISQGVFKDLFDDIENIKIVNNKELNFKLKGKNNLFIPMLTYQMSSIIKEKNGKIIGTGPYILEKINNKEVVLRKNDNYFLKNKGAKKITLIFEGSERRRIISFFNESVDGVADITNKNIIQARKEGLIPDDVLELEGKNINTITLMFGKKNKIFATRESREAIEEAIDRKALTKETLGISEVTTFFPKEFFNAKLSKIKENFNISKSRNEIKRLGLNKISMELTILNDSTSLELAKKIKKQLLNVGITVNIVPYQQEAYLMKIESKEYELSLYDIATNSN
ncbi:ABC transporter substrate-binding protein, partial [uncultured Cetobacterium sp.]|uniref:ABC transporter substrate-binding protein n=1 Tax=uncultured Cetobacterium sp. TaxID=527638 RepID=UPI0026305932